jgi:hypothetical protein
MTTPRQYATAGAFRAALEARLNERARREGVDLGRLRRQVAFDRLLARMFDRSQPIRDGWVLKGGYALEMRFMRARSTKDLDLTVRRREGASESAASLRERLLIAALVELADFFTFEIGEAMAELNQAPEGGRDSRSTHGSTVERLSNSTLTLASGMTCSNHSRMSKATTGSASPAFLQLSFLRCPWSSTGRRSFTRTRVSVTRRTAA